MNYLATKENFSINTLYSITNVIKKKDTHKLNNIKKLERDIRKTYPPNEWNKKPEYNISKNPKYLSKKCTKNNKLQPPNSSFYILNENCTELKQSEPLNMQSEMHYKGLDKINHVKNLVYVQKNTRKEMKLTKTQDKGKVTLPYRCKSAWVESRDEIKIKPERTTASTTMLLAQKESSSNIHRDIEELPFPGGSGYQRTKTELTFDKSVKVQTRNKLNTNNQKSNIKQAQGNISENNDNNNRETWAKNTEILTNMANINNYCNCLNPTNNYIKNYRDGLNDLTCLYDKIADVILSRVQHLQNHDVQKISSLLKNYLGKEKSKNNKTFSSITPDMPKWALKGYLQKDPSNNTIKIVGNLLEKMAEYIINEKGQILLSDISAFCAELIKKLHNQYNIKDNNGLQKMSTVAPQKTKQTNKKLDKCSEKTALLKSKHLSKEHLTLNTVTKADQNQPESDKMIIHNFRKHLNYKNGNPQKHNFCLNTAIKNDIRSLLFINTLNDKRFPQNWNAKINTRSENNNNESHITSLALPLHISLPQTITKKEDKAINNPNDDNKEKCLLEITRTLNQQTDSQNDEIIMHEPNTSDNVRNLKSTTPLLQSPDNKKILNRAPKETYIPKRISKIKSPNSSVTRQTIKNEPLKELNASKNVSITSKIIKGLIHSNKPQISNEKARSTSLSQRKRPASAKLSSTISTDITTSEHKLINTKSVCAQTEKTIDTQTVNDNPIESSEQKSTSNQDPIHQDAPNPRTFLRTCKTYSVFKPSFLGIRTIEKKDDTTELVKKGNYLNTTVLSAIEKTLQISNKLNVKNNTKNSKIPVRFQ